MFFFLVRDSIQVFTSLASILSGCFLRSCTLMALYPPNASLSLPRAVLFVSNGSLQRISSNRRVSANGSLHRTALRNGRFSASNGLLHRTAIFVGRLFVWNGPLQWTSFLCIELLSLSLQPVRLSATDGSLHRTGICGVLLPPRLTAGRVDGGAKFDFNECAKTCMRGAGNCNTAAVAAAAAEVIRQSWNSCHGPILPLLCLTSCLITVGVSVVSPKTIIKDRGAPYLQELPNTLRLVDTVLLLRFDTPTACTEHEEVQRHRSLIPREEKKSKGKTKTKKQKNYYCTREVYSTLSLSSLPTVLPA